jgi:hypothetical protein
MFSRDAYEMRDYEQEDFKGKPSGPLQTVGDYMLDREDVMGVADKHWNDKYGDFFDQGEDEDKQKIVVIPRYQGPKSTRVDVSPLVSNQFDVSGIPNHSQPSCVYLRQDIKFSIIKHGQQFVMESPLQLRPFAIQRQFQKMSWNAPQCGSPFDTHIQQQVRLAPYLCDAQMLANCQQINVSPYAVNTPSQVFFNYTVLEPLLGFQSGYKVLDAKRPYNQQNMKFPLAIQDYSIGVQKYDRVPDILKRLLYDPQNLLYPDFTDLGATTGIALEITNVDLAQNRLNHQVSTFETSEPELVRYSDNNALQANKAVSTVSLHAPTFVVFSSPVELAPYDIDNLKLLRAENALNHVGAVQPAQFNNATNKPSIYILGVDDGTKETTITCNTAKGYPSFFMIYLEDFGNDYYDNTFAANSNEYVNGTDMIIGAHPQIYELEIKVFGQSFPITKQLTFQELEYLTKKNCHPRCNFKDNMNLEPIVLLKLEDLGLATESVGYPSNKRLEMEVVIKQLVLPAHWNQRYRTAGQPAPPMRAYAAFVYENHVLEGNNNRMDFVWK